MHVCLHNQVLFAVLSFQSKICYKLILMSQRTSINSNKLSARQSFRSNFSKNGQTDNQTNTFSNHRNKKSKCYYICLSLVACIPLTIGIGCGYHAFESEAKTYLNEKYVALSELP